MEIGIIAIQKTASQPFTRRMNTGSPCTDAHRDLTPFTAPPSNLGTDARTFPVFKDLKPVEVLRRRGQ
jgi:hypothetical protein